MFAISAAEFAVTVAWLAEVLAVEASDVGFVVSAAGITRIKKYPVKAPTNSVAPVACAA